MAAVILVSTVPAYQAAKHYIGKPSSLGTFEVVIENHLKEPLRVNDVAEFYLSAPGSPGSNREVSSGLMRLALPSGQYSLDVPPGQSASASAMLMNEERLLPYLGAGEYFGLIIFSATPKPIRTEVLFTRETFKNGIRFIVGG